MEGGGRRQVGSVYENVSEKSVFANSENPGKPEGREVQTCVWPWGTCSPAPHLVPVGPSAAHPGCTPGPPLEQRAGSRLTSGKLCVSSLPHFATRLILVSVSVNHFL